MYKLQPEMAEVLKNTDREIYTEAPKELSDAVFIITVGDICTIKVNEQIRTPDLSIIDFKTKRNTPLTEEQKNVIENIGDKRVKVVNHPGTISDELWKAIKDSIGSGDNVRIEVDGEEDLASLAAISLSKIGTKVIYGMPDKGMVVVDVNQQEKKRANSFLKRMLVD